ncbi:MAG: hypothetical protein HC799_16175 [Limnothrix sp. RL_2_0]|nr:hypothetical protein [Limnothrix sp. RL_2_0]
MPAYLRGRTRDKLTFVRVKEGGLLFYGWNAPDLTALPQVAEGDLIALGHTTSTNIASIGGAVAIIGANSPKPARATKVLNKNPTSQQQGNASTFCGGGSYATATAAGWNISSRPRSVKFSNNPRTTTLAASVQGGGYYCFPVNTDEVTTFTTDLGLLPPTLMSTAERALSFTGTSKPRPPKVQRDTELGTQSTFCSHDAISNAITAGWELVDEGFGYISGTAGE